MVSEQAHRVEITVAWMGLSVLGDPKHASAMGIVRIVLDHEDYTGVDFGMSQRGYMRTIPGEVADDERLFLLPQGTYWRAEPTDAEQMRIDAHAAVQDADELGAKIIATAGVTSWHGLNDR